MPNKYLGKIKVPTELLEEATNDPKLGDVVKASESVRRIPIHHMGKVVGFITPRKEGKYWRAGATYVSPSYRGKDLASKAISDFFSNKNGIAYIEPGNDSSKRAFSKAGFVETGIKTMSNGDVFTVFKKEMSYD